LLGVDILGKPQSGLYAPLSRYTFFTPRALLCETEEWWKSGLMGNMVYLKPASLRPLDILVDVFALLRFV
jgi:hypothetical protein